MPVRVGLGPVSRVDIEVTALTKRNRYGNSSTYLGKDQAFIDEWNHAIDVYSTIFSGVTLIATTGDGLPDFGPPVDAITPGFEPDCDAMDTMNCRAEAAIIAHFADPSVGGGNAKATQTSGVIASRTTGGFMGQVGVKWLDAITSDGTTKLHGLVPGTSTIVSRMLGGLQFDTTFSNKKHTQHEGCPDDDNCKITPEQALFNVLQTVFRGTAVGGFYGVSTILTPPGTSAPFNYLQIYDDDIVYANQCLPDDACQMRTITNPVTNKTFGPVSAQDLLSRASSQILNKVSEPTVLNPSIINP